MLFSDVDQFDENFRENSTELQNLSQHYSTIIQRKLYDGTLENADDSEQLEFGRRAYFEINSYVRDAKELSRVLQKIITMTATKQNTSD